MDPPSGANVEASRCDKCREQECLSSLSSAEVYKSFYTDSLEDAHHSSVAKLNHLLRPGNTCVTLHNVHFFSNGKEYSGSFRGKVSRVQVRAPVWEYECVSEDHYVINCYSGIRIEVTLFPKRRPEDPAEPVKFRDIQSPPKGHHFYRNADGDNACYAAWIKGKLKAIVVMPTCTEWDCYSEDGSHYTDPGFAERPIGGYLHTGIKCHPVWCKSFEHCGRHALRPTQPL